MHQTGGPAKPTVKVKGINMGEIVGAGLLAHVPTIMLPEKIRRELNEGEDFSLVPGLNLLRQEVFEQLDYDTVIVLDSHWATTVEFVVTAQDRRAGLFTSEELPRGMCRIPYDFEGDPQLARAIAAEGEAQGTWITAIEDQYPRFFMRPSTCGNFSAKAFLIKNGSRSVCVKRGILRISFAPVVPSARLLRNRTVRFC